MKKFLQSKLLVKILWGWGGLVIGTVISMTIALNNGNAFWGQTLAALLNIYFGLGIALVILRKIYLAFNRPVATPQPS